MKFEWEILVNSNTPSLLLFTKRGKVFGGWIVNNINYLNDNNQSISESMVFIPDPEHKWSVD